MVIEAPLRSEQTGPQDRPLDVVLYSRVMRLTAPRMLRPCASLGWQTALVWSGAIGDSGDGDLSRRGRGRIPARRLSVTGDDGQSLEVMNEPADGAPSVRLTVIREIRSHRFDRCPICLTPEPDSEEHVPPTGAGWAAPDVDVRGMQQRSGPRRGGSGRLARRCASQHEGDGRGVARRAQASSATPSSDTGRTVRPDHRRPDAP